MNATEINDKHDFAGWRQLAIEERSTEGNQQRRERLELVELLCDELIPAIVEANPERAAIVSKSAVAIDYLLRKLWPERMKELDAQIV